MNLMFRTKFILGVSFLSVIACAAVFIELQNVRDKGHGFHQGSRLNSNKILPLNPEASAHALVNPPARYSMACKPPPPLRPWPRARPPPKL